MFTVMFVKGEKAVPSVYDKKSLNLDSICKKIERFPSLKRRAISIPIHNENRNKFINFFSSKLFIFFPVYRKCLVTEGNEVYQIHDHK